MSIPPHTLFWKNIEVGSEKETDNAPERYADKGNDKQGANILHGLDTLALRNDKNLNILELGCNVGRNLNFLLNDNFKNLNGIEINTHAVELCKKVYPALFDLNTSNIYNGRLYDFLPEHKTVYDVVYTMAVMMHIDDDEREIIYNYLEKHAKHVIFIEPRNEPKKKMWGGRLFNIFDYGIHMKKRGFTQISRSGAHNGLEQNYDIITFRHSSIIS